MGFISTAKHVLSAAKLVWKSSKGWCLIWDVITCWYLRPIYETDFSGSSPNQPRMRQSRPGRMKVLERT